MQIQNDQEVNQAELGQRIRATRERVGMSQEQLADAVERDQKAISEYENGKRKLAATELAVFARVLGVPISYFYEGEYHIDELDQLLLQEFRSLPTTQDKQAAIQIVRIISTTIKRNTSSTNE